MEVYIRANGQDDEQVPQYCDQVYGQEEPEQERLLLWLLREAQEKKLIDASPVSSVHVQNLYEII